MKQKDIDNLNYLRRQNALSHAYSPNKTSDMILADAEEYLYFLENGYSRTRNNRDIENIIRNGYIMTTDCTIPYNTFQTTSNDR